MEVYGNYRKYKEHLPEYKDWSEKQELQLAKRLAYLKEHPDKLKPQDIERGKALINAIDIMDEYSQSNAEDMEVATEMAMSQVAGLTSMIGTFLGSGLLLLPKMQKLLSKLNGSKQMMLAFIPSIAGMLVGALAAFPMISWGTKQQVTASRRGRFEAMRNDLKNPALFAVLNDKQREEAKELAKNIEIEDKDKKRLEKMRKLGGGGPFEVFKTLKKIFKDDEYKAQKEEFDKVIKESEKQFGKELTPEQINAAKRDKQLLADLVRKIDIASQDYAENTELATNTITTLSLAGGGLVGWVTHKISKLFMVNSSSKAGKILPFIAGAIVPIAFSIYAAKVQKFSSRIGRYKAKQEFLNNPQTLVYVDDKDADKMKDVKASAKIKKPNIFKFFAQLYKDNRAYNKYMKNERLEELKYQKAVEQMKLSDEQMQEAKVLQMNTFKTFNKVDDKSQTYSESVEAVGEIVKQGLAFFTFGASVLWTSIAAMKFAGAKQVDKKAITSFLLQTLGPLFVSILPIIGLDIYVTKEQKKASRVADMLALKELDDYRNYADYSKTKNVDEPKIQVLESSNLLKRFQK